MEMLAWAGFELWPGAQLFKEKRVCAPSQGRQAGRQAGRLAGWLAFSEAPGRTNSCSFCTSACGVIAWEREREREREAGRQAGSTNARELDCPPGKRGWS